MRVKIRLDTMRDVNDFVNICSTVEEPVFLTGDGFRVSAKSLIGALYTMEWNDVWCECERDIYTIIRPFCL